MQTETFRKRDWPLERRPGRLIIRLARLATRFAEARLHPLGFGVAAYPVIQLLTDQGEQSQKQLTEKLQVEQSSMAQLLGRLERNSLIERRTDPDDRRSSLIALTAKARSALPQIKQIMNDGNDIAVTGLTDDEIELALDLLERMIANLETATATSV